jgi:hypothetical protein
MAQLGAEEDRAEWNGSDVAVRCEAHGEVGRHRGGRFCWPRASSSPSDLCSLNLPQVSLSFNPSQHPANISHAMCACITSHEWCMKRILFDKMQKMKSLVQYATASRKPYSSYIGTTLYALGTKMLTCLQF